MKKLVAILAILQCLILAPALSAQNGGGARLVSSTSWVEEWDPVAERWVKVEEVASNDDRSDAGAPVTTVTTHIVNGQVVSQTETVHLAARYAMPLPRRHQAGALGKFGPFRVIDAKRAIMVGSTDAASPAHFDAMMEAYPGIEVLEMIDAPGTNHDIANLAVGRRIRAAGLATHVPSGGSVRSGAVELFLAGETRSMDRGARFAVHSWMDNYGREPADFAPDAPENRLYLDYYIEMGMSEARARDFYAMTNSVPHADALWLRADDMAFWVAPEPRHAAATQLTGAEEKLAPVAFFQMPAGFPALLLEPIEVTPMSATAPVIDYREMTRIALGRATIGKHQSY